MQRVPPLLVLLLCGCAATIPKDSFGVSSVEVTGAEHMDDAAIKACLATFPRERFGFALGSAATPKCGVPPFDDSRVTIDLWAWPWTDWPLFNQTAFERDQDRIERWYQARGYYDARVTAASANKHENEVDVAFTVTEGEPTLIVRISVEGLKDLPPAVQSELSDVIELQVGEPFDEALYDRSKRALLEVLQEASYARAEVVGGATVDPAQRIARVSFKIIAGPPCTFGDVMIEGNKPLPKRPIRAAAAIERGAPFSLSALQDARVAIFGLGPFASVEIEQHLRPDSPVVDVLIRVTPGRMLRFGVGIGMTSGGLYPEAPDVGVDTNFAQWDVHLLGKIEHRNFLGGMRTLRVEDRPRLIFNDSFPDASDPHPGNLLTVELRQPAFIEPRTTLVAEARWDRGPDPYGGEFLRHDVILGLGPERRFLGGALRLSATINADLFFPDEQRPYPNTHLTYLYYLGQLDLRDNPRNTRKGAYFSLGLQQAGYFMPSDWDYVRVTEDNRGYIPLGNGLVLAARFRIGIMLITSTALNPPETFDPSDTDAIFLANLANIGPLRHRLRGGGPNSVRGYAPNTLGDVQVVDGRLLSGGLRQWEASLELRIPMTENFGAVLFADAGDVTQLTHFRFDYPQPSFGLGLRYHTIVGPVRFDFALAPPGIQVIGPDERIRTGVEEDTIFGIQYAISFTIGEAF